MIPGLYQLIAKKRSGARWTFDNDPTPTGRRNADRLDEEAEQHEVHARSNEALIPMIELVIHDLTTSTIQSAQRTLAIRALEEASMRLNRELGPKGEPETLNGKH